VQGIREGRGIPKPCLSTGPRDTPPRVRGKETRIANTPCRKTAVKSPNALAAPPRSRCHVFPTIQMVLLRVSAKRIDFRRVRSLASSKACLIALTCTGGYHPPRLPNRLWRNPPGERRCSQGCLDYRSCVLYGMCSCQGKTMIIYARVPNAHRVRLFA
jgi:hypothetical protein